MENMIERFSESVHIEDSPERRANFRVAVFGTSSSESVHDKLAMDLSRKIADNTVSLGRHKLVTGGYQGGIMGAASEAGKAAALRNQREDLIPEGITIGNVLGEQSKDAIIKETASLTERLQKLIDESGAIVILHGKVGTIAELQTSIISTAVDRAKSKNKEIQIRKPIIISDSSLQHADTLASLKRFDPKRINDFSKDIYIVSVNPNMKETELEETSKKINDIIETYYTLSLGGKIDDENQDELEKISLKKFLDNQESVSEGGGI